MTKLFEDLKTGLDEVNSYLAGNTVEYEVIVPTVARNAGLRQLAEDPTLRGQKRLTSLTEGTKCP